MDPSSSVSVTSTVESDVLGSFLRCAEFLRNWTPAGVSTVTLLPSFFTTVQGSGKNGAESLFCIV